MDISQCVLNLLITYTKPGEEVKKIVHSLPLHNKPSSSKKLYSQYLHWTLISEVTGKKRKRLLWLKLLWSLKIAGDFSRCFNQVVQQTFLYIVHSRERMRDLLIHVCMCVYICVFGSGNVHACHVCQCVWEREKESLEDWQLQQSLHAGLNARLARSGSGSSGCLLPFGTQWLEYPLLY